MRRYLLQCTVFMTLLFAMLLGVRPVQAQNVHGYTRYQQHGQTYYYRNGRLYTYRNGNYTYYPSGYGQYYYRNCP